MTGSYPATARSGPHRSVACHVRTVPHGDKEQGERRSSLFLVAMPLKYLAGWFDRSRRSAGAMALPTRRYVRRRRLAENLAGGVRADQSRTHAKVGDEGGFGFHSRSFVTATRPKSSLNHKLKSVAWALTADTAQCLPLRGT